MTQINQQRLRELFESVMDLPPIDRAAVLDAACAGNGALRAELDSLLSHHDADVSVLADHQAGIGMKVASEMGYPAHDPSLPERIGAYRIVRVLGAGGMGIVYEAEQEHPVRRRVALKVIKLGMDTREVVARFQQERQALAMLDHPNIAKVLDAGATDTGRPYFVMELCAGDRITDYCDAHHLTIQARLGLFVQVCQAIQHAHQKALIHRDIKPSNILVTTHDRRPLAKVIDFGIAKATGDKLTDVTLHTEAVRLLGTPEYMSPEQAEGSRDIDTQTDVYSLGVLLYEILTGCTPFSGRNFATESLTNVVRIIREVEPVRPSTRVRDVGANAIGIADSRGISPQRLPSILQGDLDWIVTKAIEKDRSRRYATAGALADDVNRYLAGDPVHAAPPSTLYRVHKFVRRNRGKVLGAGVVTAALIVGAVGTLWQASVARREARVARAAERDARRIAEFQAQMLEQIDPSSAGDELLANMRTQFTRGIARNKLAPDVEKAAIAEFEQQLRQLNSTDLAADLIDNTILRPSVDSIAREFSEQPAIEASLNQTLATLYRAIGRYPDARPLQEKALETRKRVLGESHPDTLASMHDLGYLMRLQGDIPGAEALLNETLTKCKAALGPDHPVTLITQSTCGGILRLRKQYPESEACWRDVLERRRRVLGQDNPYTIISINNLGAVLQDAGKLEEAETFFREALERGRRALGPDNPTTLITQNFLGGLLWRQNRLDESESVHRETLEKRRRILGELHPRTINSIANLGELLFAAGKNAEAEPLLREAYEKRRQVLGASHPHTLASIDGFAGMLEAEARWNEAEPLRRHAASSLAETKSRSGIELVTARLQLGRVLLELGRLAEAEKELIAAHESTATGGPGMDDAEQRCARLLVQLYNTWDMTDPGNGHAAQRELWNARVDSESSKVNGTNEHR
ncbi:hypothetical protein B7486_14475 [cyanobacterium TDX16]|nr:hypothetical protein B7486_14475 [cyanobacterium TDX16]